MKRLLQPFTFLSALAAIVLTVGCAHEIQQQENLLSVAGFKSVVASTPNQLAKLATLPADKISVVSRKGKSYFVFPDPKNNVLYVGTQKEYTTYQQLRLQKKLAAESVAAAEFNQEAAQDTWDGFSDDWYGM